MRGVTRTHTDAKAKILAVINEIHATVMCWHYSFRPFCPFFTLPFIAILREMMRRTLITGLKQIGRIAKCRHLWSSVSAACRCLMDSAFFRRHSRTGSLVPLVERVASIITISRVTRANRTQTQQLSLDLPKTSVHLLTVNWQLCGDGLHRAVCATSSPLLLAPCQMAVHKPARRSEMYEGNTKCECVV